VLGTLTAEWGRHYDAAQQQPAHDSVCRFFARFGFRPADPRAPHGGSSRPVAWWGYTSS
jgi:hypothetical protein